MLGMLTENFPVPLRGGDHLSTCLVRPSQIVGEDRLQHLRVLPLLRGQSLKRFLVSPLGYLYIPLQLEKSPEIAGYPHVSQIYHFAVHFSI